MKLIDADRLLPGLWDYISDADYEKVKKVIYELPSAEPDLDEHSAWFRIGETLVDESKAHISAQEACEKIREYLRRMKKPERKTGKWISHIEHCEMNNLKPSGLGSYFWCSECDCGIDSKYFHRVNYDYCPNCGSYNGGEQNEPE